MLNKGNYKDFLLVDTEGRIIWADIGNPQYFKVGLTSITGLNLRDIYSDIDNDYPLLQVMRTGKAIEKFEIDMTTHRGIKVRKTGCAYPIFKTGRAIAAIEFGDFFYDRNHIGDIEGHSEHMIYRGNNTKYVIDDIITGDPQMIALKKKIEDYAITDSTVFIYGETGTGKELIAQALHNCSRRYYRKFISQNCGAIPENLLEGILFGTTKGSFTGAEDKPGLFELAEGGTLFLDEINSLSINLQTKILQSVESKVTRRIGSSREIKGNVRIIAATNEEPADLIRQGRMKEDLYYRLAVIYIRLPRLAERDGDIRKLTNYFVDYFNKRMNSRILPPEEEVMRIFENYSWPGNVRELRNVLEGAFAFADDEKITIDDIPDYILQSAGMENEGSRKASGSLSANMQELERNIIMTQYEKDGRKLTATAKDLGITKQLLRYKLDRYEK
jgi:Transcriptional regulator containing PAS, AAA-type ATPase, and DNA-binding domains